MINQEKLKIAYDKIKDNLDDDKFLVGLGKVLTTVEIGVSLFEGFYNKDVGDVTALGVASLITGYLTYKLNKKNKASQEKLKNLENKL